MGFWESGLAEIDQAIDRDPLGQRSRLVRAGLLSRLRRFPAAIQTLETEEAKSGTWRTVMATVLFRAGKLDRARDVLSRAQEREPPGSTEVANALSALIKAAAGHSEEVSRALEEIPLEKRRRSDYVPLLCGVAGNKKLLLDQIEHWTNLSSYRWLIDQPLLRPYRSDPEFQELVRRLHRDWQQNLKEFATTVPVKPPTLPSPEQYFKQ